MKKLLISIILLLLTGQIACTDFIAKVNRQNDWEIIKSNNVVLHYRPVGFSQSSSPTSEEAKKILQNQNIYYKLIPDSISQPFNDRVIIYLYNKDEARDLIGTNNGGHAIPKFNTFYYTFIVGMRQFTDTYGIENPFIGAHEMVHIITHRTLGYPGTRFMSEGYAVWLDGSYGRYPIESIIRHYRDEQSEKILTPDQLLIESTLDESIFYPNSGLFTRFLVHTYGLVNINKLFTTSRDHFKDTFKRLTGVNWQTMSDEYHKYLVNL